ncbi:MAG: hypothetical protein PWQ96_1417 [Clostridia bacterium]|nr:hypothetical protein [Clostridiales bacterium]MDK2985775.1 hypothetical protein [Clostridia bacterium]
MKRVKGMVMKVSGQEVFLVTPDGEFVKGRYHEKPPLPGQEIELEIPAANEMVSNKVRKYPLASKNSLALVAVILLLFLSISIFNVFIANQPAAYLALDINPSMEFSLDQKGVVLAATALNEDAVKVLKNSSPKGLHISAAITKVLEEVARQGYLKDTDNVIQLTLARRSKCDVTKEEIETIVTEELQEKNVSALYKVYETDAAERKKAQEKNISLNQLSLLKELSKKGIKIDENELKEKPGQLVKKYKQLGNYKKIIAKKERKIADKKKENKGQTPNKFNKSEKGKGKNPDKLKDKRRDKDNNKNQNFQTPGKKEKNKPKIKEKIMEEIEEKKDRFKDKDKLKRNQDNPGMKIREKILENIRDKNKN